MNLTLFTLNVCVPQRIATKFQLLLMENIFVQFVVSKLVAPAMS